jgi:predicted RNA-binding Zn-ribbon protein involved in translation (DUF1610 family)
MFPNKACALFHFIRSSSWWKAVYSGKHGGKPFIVESSGKQFYSSCLPFPQIGPAESAILVRPQLCDGWVCSACGKWHRIASAYHVLLCTACGTVSIERGMRRYQRLRGTLVTVSVRPLLAAVTVAALAELFDQCGDVGAAAIDGLERISHLGSCTLDARHCSFVWGYCN